MIIFASSSNCSSAKEHHPSKVEGIGLIPISYYFYDLIKNKASGSSVGRASPLQGEVRWFESNLYLPFKIHGVIAQSVRAPVLHAGGRRFKSCWLRFLLLWKKKKFGILIFLKKTGRQDFEYYVLCKISKSCAGCGHNERFG